MNIPNILTLVRFLLIPILIYFIAIDQIILSICTFILSGITDFLDGYIARKYNLISNFGKIMDPLADKLIQFSALVMLGLKGFIPFFIIVVIFIKEVLMGLGFLILYKNNVIIPALWYGKLTTIIFYAAIILSLIIPNSIYSNSLLIIGVATAVFALVMYFMNYLKIRKSSKK